MKAINIFTILVMSVLTFVWLACCKIYDTYIKKNILVQCCMYIFWTLIMCRILLWTAKPFLHGIDLKHFINTSHISIHISHLSPIIAIGIYILFTTVVGLYIMGVIKKLDK